MKNKYNSRIGQVLSNIIDVRGWFDWDRMKAFTQYLVSGIGQLFVPQKAKVVEPFEEAKARMNLTDSELLARQKGLFRLSIIMVVFAILLFVYAVTLLVEGSIRGFILGLVVTTIALILAFRYHFWYFQIKERKLGCTIQEWFKQGIMGDKR